MSKEKKEEAGLIECVVTQGKFHVGRGETVTKAVAGQVVKVTANQYEKFKDCLRKITDIKSEAEALKAQADKAVAEAVKTAKTAKEVEATKDSSTGTDATKTGA